MNDDSIDTAHKLYTHCTNVTLAPLVSRIFTFAKAVNQVASHSYSDGKSIIIKLSRNTAISTIHNTPYNYTSSAISASNEFIFLSTFIVVG